MFIMFFGTNIYIYMVNIEDIKKKITFFSFTFFFLFFFFQDLLVSSLHFFSGGKSFFRILWSVLFASLFAAGHACHVLLLVFLMVLSFLCVEIFQLREGFLLQHQLVERRRVLAHAVPRAGCVADQILRRGDPCFALSRHSLHAVDAYFTIFAVENVLEQILIVRASVQLVEKRRCHHRGRLFIAIESKFGAGRVARADVRIDRVADSCHVWALCQIYIYKIKDKKKVIHLDK